MPTHFFNISPEELKRLYKDEQLLEIEIAEKHGFSRQAVSRYLAKYGIEKRSKGQTIKLAHKKGRVNPPSTRPWLRNTFSTEPSPELSYVLGVLLGDGYCAKDKHNHYIVELKAKDREFLFAFSYAAARLFNKVPKKPYYYAKRDRYMVRYHSRNFHDWFKSLNLQDIEKNVQNFEQYFIKGVVDSEGSVSTQLRITNTDTQLLSLVKKLLSKFNISAKLQLRSKKGSRFMLRNRLATRYKDVYDLFTIANADLFLYVTQIGFTIKRKHQATMKRLQFALKRLRQYCRAINLHQQGLGNRRIAKKLQIPRGTVLYWLRGDAKPHLVTSLIRDKKIDVCSEPLFWCDLEVFSEHSSVFSSDVKVQHTPTGATLYK